MTTFLSDTYHLFLRQSRQTLRQPIWIVVTLVQPVVWLTLFGQLFRQVVELPGFGTGSYIEFLTPGILMVTALFGSMWSGESLLEDLSNGVVDRFMATPMSRGAFIAARVLHTTVVATAQSIIILALGLALGATFPGGFGGVVVILVAAALLSASVAALSNGLALLARREETLIAILNFISMPLTFLSTALIAAALMPAWMRFVSQGNPLNWAIIAGRNAILGQNWMTVWGYGGLLLALVVAAGFLALGALRLYRRAV